MTTYLLAIGGTGARVLRSLTMLLAAGAKDTSTTKEIVPIIIDYDGDNGDTKRTQDLLENYQRIQRQCYGFRDHDEHFFCTPLTKLRDKVGQDRAANFHPGTRFNIHLEDLDDNTIFSDFIGHAQLNNETKTAPTRHLLDSLYNTSDKEIYKNGEYKDNPDAELHMKLYHGFRGCPSLGCVVTRQLTDNKELTQLENIVNAGDRIFIVGSIFGGTGASGIPTLVDYFRNGPAAQAFAHCKVGVLAVMPYFKVAEDKDSPISSKAFVAKAKAALDTYDNTVRQYVDALYLVGDNATTEAFDNNEGGGSQKNEAHIVELAGAMMFLDFMNRSENVMNIGDVYEMGLANNHDGATALVYSDFCKEETCVPYIDPMSKLVLFKTFCQNYFIPGKNEARDIWLVRTDLGSKRDLKDNLSTFFKEFENWIIELEGPKRPLKLYNIKESNYLKIYEYMHLEGHGLFGQDAFHGEDIREALSNSNGDASKKKKGDTTITNEEVYSGHVEELFMVNSKNAMDSIFNNKINPYISRK